MLKLLMLSGSLVVTVGCATIKVPNHKVYVTLPATGKGYWVETLTNKEGEIPKEEWDEKKKRGIVLMSEDWAAIKKSISSACLRDKQCKQLTGALDDLFQAIDDGLGVMLP